MIAIGKVDCQRAADNWLDARPRHLFGEFERSEHVVGIGQRECRLFVGFGEFGEPRDGQRALEQRIGRVHVQMHEIEIGHLFRSFVG